MLLAMPDTWMEPAVGKKMRPFPPDATPTNDAKKPCTLEAEKLGAFLDGRLASDEAQAIEAHLAECESCRWVAGRSALVPRP